VSSGDALPANLRALLNDGLGKVKRGDLSTDSVLAHFDASGARPALVAWHVTARPTPDRPAIVGIVADPSLATGVFARIVKESPLLPPSLAGATRDLLTVRVSTPDGHDLFASSTLWSQYANQTTLDTELGALRIQVALTETAADRLIIGGLPRNRVPLLIGLLAVTAGLMALAFVQLRRERELVRLRANFVSGVSHELRTPLAQIRMFGETLLLNRVRSSEEHRRSLEIIVQESQRLTQLIENVLQFGRVERGGAVVTPVADRVDLRLHDIVEGFEPLARSRRTSIARRIDEGIVAPVDADALRQIVLNLLDNALKYGPSGQTIVVSCRRDGDRAAIAVEDEGPGVSEADSSRIWDPYYRVAPHGASVGGTGIGLTIVKRLTEMHGGHAHVERGARGARFVVELPGALQEHAAATVRIASAGV
jgi:signal transduction histidine kinase